MKTYTTGQLIEVLKEGQVAKPTQFTKSNVCLNDNGHLVWRHNGNLVPIAKYTMDYEWEVTPQYVTFEEALKAYREGKRINYENSDESGGFYMVNGSANAEVRWHDIITAKWWIEEDAE